MDRCDKFMYYLANLICGCMVIVCIMLLIAYGRKLFNNDYETSTVNNCCYCCCSHCAIENE